MAKWKVMLSRKSAGPPAGHTEPVTVASIERTRISKAYRNPARIRYETRIDGPQGWRSSFMSL